MDGEAEVWGDFWADEAGREPGGCLPGRWAGIENAQKAIWHEFIGDLEEGARVLDLATGDGRVLRWMGDSRPDLVRVGIDIAPELPPPPPGIEIHTGVAMHKLPFEDDSFAVVVSQFGFEYGDVRKTAREIVRVLAPGGKVGLLVHRGDGPILKHNRKRRSELLWALRERGVARKVRAILDEGPDAIPKAVALAAKVARQGNAKYGPNSPAWEIPEAIRRSCVMGQRAGVGSIVETVSAIETRARNELGRIQSLASACATADARGRIVKAFAAGGLGAGETRSVTEPSGRVLADFITFS